MPSEDSATPQAVLPPPRASGSHIASEKVGSPEATSASPLAPSHFPIIYLPGNAPALPTAPAFRCEDATTLEREFAEGGVTMSVHSPDDAVSWLESHYDDPLLESLRLRNFQGPIAVQLAPGESALAVFGSVADAMIPQLAKALVEASGFAVMVRSSTDNPLIGFAQSDEMESPAAVSTEQPPPVSTDPTAAVSTDQRLTVSAEQPMARLRGGAADSDDGDDDDDDDYSEYTTGSQVMLPKWDGQPHTAKVTLTLKLGDAKYTVVIISDMHFKTQRRSQGSSGEQLPEVGSFVSLKVKLCRGETSLDKSFSNIGFLVHRQPSILLCDL
ncbi:hypothetical protein B0H13DRAFT_1885388 [Mycena leptocephala]|nr:hypothetical protein B0H13DRAFT_1885388 [Mycena leptocephala]